jgi:putative nucleotidyltransferase with HDIG domain
VLVKTLRLLHAYVFAVCVLAVLVLIYLRADFTTPADEGWFWNAFCVLLVLGLLSEVSALQIPKSTTTLSVAFIPTLASILLLGPAWAIVVAGTAELLAEAAIRQKPFIKIAHNTARVIIAVGVAGALYVFAGGQVASAPTTRDLLAFFPAAATYIVLVNGAAATAVSLSTRAELHETWGQLVGKAFVVDLFSSSISVLLAYLYIQRGIVGLLLVVVPLFLVRHAMHRNLQLEQANRDLLELMVKSIEARDPYTSGHSVRVAAYAKALARALGLPVKELEQIETAALLHDVGKIYEEFAPLLRKRGSLTSIEMKLIRTHPSRSAELVSTISSLRGYVEKCVRAHHENYDGGGYPDGLAGSEIPIGARIIAIADTADAMMTDRPYRRPMSYDEVLAELDRYAGTQFDPEVVAAFKHSTAVRRLTVERQDEVSTPVGAVADMHPVLISERAIAVVPPQGGASRQL